MNFIAQESLYHTNIWVYITQSNIGVEDLLVYLIAKETCHTWLNLKPALTDSFIKLLKL